MKFAFIQRAIVKERRESIEWRKVLLIRLLAKPSVGLQVSDHIVEPMTWCSPRLSTRPRRRRIEALYILPLRAITALGQDEERGGNGGEAGSGRGLGPTIHHEI